jgi:nucleotidyltransferase/DNA polymerase involved in DNA repair
MAERYIIHVDMDAFFAAVEQRDDPSLRGKPVIIGADPKGGAGRGVVSTCSYEARKFGVRSAMPISEAWRRCPNGVFLEPDFSKYSAASELINKIFYDFTPDIEPVSIDEAFLDITHSYKLFGAPPDVCRLIKERIKSETGLTASVGLAPTKMAAKIASDLQKPDGLVVVPSGKAREFLAPLDIGRLWGLGPKAAEELRGRGVNTIGQLAQMNVVELDGLFGRHGRQLRELALGHDDREVLLEYEAKSVSNETTFEADTEDERGIAAALLALCDKVSSRLRADGLKGRTITLKIRLTGFVTFTRSVTIVFATNYTDVIHERVMVLYGDFKRGGKKIRLLGVKVSGLMPAGDRESLFEDEMDGRRERVHKAVEDIRGKFGRGAIYRAGGKKNI